MASAEELLTSVADKAPRHAALAKRRSANVFSRSLCTAISSSTLSNTTQCTLPQIFPNSAPPKSIISYSLKARRLLLTLELTTPCCYVASWVS